MSGIFTYSHLQENLSLVKLPPGEWKKFVNREFSFVAFTNIENDLTKRKVIIRQNLSVEVYLREKLVSWVHLKKPKNINDVNEILYMIAQIEWYAALAHYKLVHIHPFSDGNGRTSRLLMNMILMQAGYPPVIIHKQRRHEYYENLQIANGGDVRPFVRFIAECTDQTLDLFLWATSEFSKQVPALSQDSFSNQKQSTIMLDDDDSSEFEND